MDATQEKSRVFKHFHTVFGSQSLETPQRTELAVREFRIAVALKSGMPWDEAKLAADNEEMPASSAQCARLVERLLFLRTTA